MFFKSNKPYALSKSRHIMKASNKWYKKKGKTLPPDQLAYFETHLQSLDQALLKKNQVEADKEARLLEEYCNQHFKKSPLDYLVEVGLAVLVALVIATIVRSSWFELYEIPTGSMRPTFEEQDHLSVTKTAFGINVPLETDHFYFDPALVQRTSVVIWSGDGVPQLNSESKFMGIFPYTKRFIKRCMGKPGDTLYFYGGKMYAFDEKGNDLTELRDSPWMSKLEHIPFTHFEGRRSYANDPLTRSTNQVVFHLMNQAIGRIRFSPGEMRGEIFNGKEWIQDKPDALKQPHDTIQTYSDFWGIRNYATARLLNKEQLKKLSPDNVSQLDDGILYMELRHTPSLTSPLPLISNNFGVLLSGYTTVIPLQKDHLKALMDNMYTCRFIVKGGKAHAYRLEESEYADKNANPSLPGVPDGTYEFYYGKAYKIGFGAIPTELPVDHPLYSLKPEHVQKLYNIGIDMSIYVEPSSREQYFPSRYVYFREGDLFTMGGAMMKKGDPLLESFNQRELAREKGATGRNPYIAFKDYGAPITTEGKLDHSFLQAFGYKIPPNSYLMLGDNHAMSQDSRWFGPIPQANLQGAPSLILWPPGPRWGIPLQKPYPLFNLPRLIVWTIAGIILLAWWIIHQRRLKRPMFKKLY